MPRRTDTISPQKRSEIMSSIRSTGNKATELFFVRILRIHRIIGWRRNAKIIGRPDFVFSRERVAVFVDGCFWHGCSKHCRMPKSNIVYWNSKIRKNMNRDRSVDRSLSLVGWLVVRFWEHELQRPGKCAQKIKQHLSRSKQHMQPKSES